MTDNKTFIVKGIERIILPQIIRSNGILFLANMINGKNYFYVKTLPLQGPWVEIETTPNKTLTARINLHKKFPATLFLRIFGLNSYEKIIKHFNKEEQIYIKNTLELEGEIEEDEVFVQLYKNIRTSDPQNKAEAKNVMMSMFDEKRYDISEIGRVRFNERVGLDTKKNNLNKRNLQQEDVIAMLKEIIRLNTDDTAVPDDIDHLGFRKVRLVGELIATQAVLKGIAKLRKSIQNKMSIVDVNTVQITDIITYSYFQSAVMDFFRTNSLSQPLRNKNLLDEFEHIRTLSLLGPGGLTRERAGFEVRDVHSSHYGRICPILVPDGQSVGLSPHLSMYAKVNSHGIIETPYSVVENRNITNKVDYLTPHQEENNFIAMANSADKKDKVSIGSVLVRYKGETVLVDSKKVKYIDVASSQILSISPSLIPFINHNIGVRATFGSTMQRRTIPCLMPEEPLVGTGYEDIFASNSSRVILAEFDGTITKVDAKIIVLEKGKEKKTHELITFSPVDGYSFHQRPVIKLGQNVKKGDLLCEIASMNNGQLAIGKNLKVAIMCWSGYNTDDAIVISKKLVKNDALTLVYLKTLEIDVLDTRLGPEVTTYDIPNVSESKLGNLDEEGIITTGSNVKQGDILVGKITPRPESQLTSEERIIHQIFGDKAKEMKDSSLKVPIGIEGRVIDIQIFRREEGYVLDAGVIKKVKVTLANLRKVQVGDKLSNRHGGKGVIATILPEEDMPYTKDGEPVDIVLTPLGIPSRMNIGQILEMHLGLAAKKLNYQAIVPPCSGVTLKEIGDELEKAGYDRSGTIPLFDGRTGEKFDRNIGVGYMYILRLDHQVEEYVHMRSIGHYSLISQQPLRGKVRGGGQKLGEMEVWALLGYGAAYTLREMLTIKSDDIFGRSAAFESIIRGKSIRQPSLPISFNVLLYYLRGLGLNIVLNKK